MVAVFWIIHNSKTKTTEKKLAAMKIGWIKGHQNRLDRIKKIKESAASEIKSITIRSNGF